MPAKIQPRHGHIYGPESRAYKAFKNGQLDSGALNQREAGKFFPQTEAGLSDPKCKDDIRNFAPPPDGKIASANQATGQFLDAPGTQWEKNIVKSGEEIDFKWYFSASHLTRRWNYFITKEEWNPNEVLSRAQFEEKPHWVVEYGAEPYWSHANELMPPKEVTHTFRMPVREGYHVMLAVWEVADTGNAFYQVIDFDFQPGDNDDRPRSPVNLRASELTDQLVTLSWDASSGKYPITLYRVSRDGQIIGNVVAGGTSAFTDENVKPDSHYVYSVVAVDSEEQVSAPATLSVQTPTSGGDDALPSAPVSLHVMSKTDTTVNLMWSESVAPTGIKQYHLYRDGVDVLQVSGSKTSVQDIGLTPSTTYRYFVAAEDNKGRFSVPGNVISVTTADNNSNDLPEWKLGATYKVGDKVRYQNKKWICLQSHTASSPDWAPGLAITLWSEIK